MRSLVSYLLALVVTLGVGSPVSAADELKIDRKHHPWGRYPVGAWKIVRVITETLDEQGTVTSRNVTETKTSLAEVGDDGVTLEVRTIVELVGRRFESEPQIVKQGFHGELAGHDLKIKDCGPGIVTVEERAIPCRILETESLASNARTTTRISFSDALSPYVLKRQSTTTNLAGKATLDETTVEVVALNMPCDAVSDVRCGTQVKTTHKHPNGSISTLAFVSPDIPGGVVCHQSKETDKNGRAIRNSTLKVVSYGLDPESERTGLFGRKRTTRLRKVPGAFGDHP